jgi:hypothetical protein
MHDDEIKKRATRFELVNAKKNQKHVLGHFRRKANKEVTMTTAAPPSTHIRPFSSLRYRFTLLLLLISCLGDFYAIAQQKENQKDEIVEAPRDDTFTEEHGLVVLSSST